MLVSRDFGKTWHEVVPPWDTWQGSQQTGIHVSGGNAVIVGAGNNGHTLRRYDLATNKYVADTHLDNATFAFPILAQGDTVYEAQEAATPTAVLEVMNYSLRSGTFAHQGPTSAATKFIANLFPSGDAWLGVQLVHGPDRFCVGRFSFAPADDYTVACTSLAYFPPAIDHYTVPGYDSSYVALSDVPVVIGDQGGSFAARLQPDAKPDIVALGDLKSHDMEGAVASDQVGFDLHSRWGRLLRFENGWGEVPATGPALKVDFPQTPCANDACGANIVGEPLFIAELDGNDALVFYKVTTTFPPPAGMSYNGNEYQEDLYLRQVTLEKTPITGDIPTGPGAHFPDVTPAGPLTIACYTAGQCFHTPGTFYTQLAACSYLWQQFPASDPRRKAFEDAGLKGCTAMATAWPEAAIVGSVPCNLGCQGDIAIRRCDFDSMHNREYVGLAYDCKMRGLSCSGGACVDGGSMGTGGCSANGTAHLSDSSPLSCTSVGKMCLMGACTTGQCSTLNACDGNVSRTCNMGVEVDTDCAGSGEICGTNPLGAFCAPAKMSPKCPTSGMQQFPLQCSGPLLTWCDQGGLFAIPCDQIGGFTGCTDMGGGSAACTP
jgi:hypothetical protein